MTVTVFFVRHAAHDRLGKVLCGRMPGVRLGEEGGRQALAVANRLRSEPITAVFTSPLERARQTAEAIGDAFGLIPETIEALNEIEFGAWTGAEFSALDAQPAWQEWNRRRAEARPPGGECVAEVRQRLSEWLDDLADRRSGEAVAAVSHADVIKTALSDVLGLSPDQHQQFDIGPGSISVVVKGPWGAKVHSINEAPR